MVKMTMSNVVVSTTASGHLGCRAAREMVVMKSPLTLIARLFQPQLGYLGCRAAREMVVMRTNCAEYERLMEWTNVVVR